MTNNEKIKTASIDEIAAKIVELTEICENFCAYTNERGKCQYMGMLSGCIDGVKEYLMSEVEE